MSLELSAGGGRPTLAELSATPVLLDCAQTNVATGRDAARIADRLQRLSAELGTRLDPAGGGRLRWRPATAPASGA